MPLDNCPECDAPLIFVVDGVEMSYVEIIKLLQAPKEIKLEMNHQLWCTRIKEY